MELTDVRRLTGASLSLDRPGAAAEAVLNDDQKDQVIAIWRTHMRKTLDAVGWSVEEISVRQYDGGATLLMSAPIDALYAATDLMEAAWASTEAEVQGLQFDEFENKISELRTIIADERNPNLLELEIAALEKNITLLSDDEIVSLGLGENGQCWDTDKTPSPDQVNWEVLGDIPVALVTGTNGKSTTVRLSAAICAVADKTVGMSSSDWVRAGKDIIASGDYSGPGGARLALRDQRVDMAVIETARGGLLRRGLPIPSVTASLITNVASDHLGEYGIQTVPDLADVKFTISKAVKSGGTLILNADDPLLVERGQSFDGQVFWYGFSINDSNLDQWAPDGAPVAYIKNGDMVLRRGGEDISILPVIDFVPGLGGVAKYNISNGLGAIALTSTLGIEPAAITQGLKEFESTPEENPGRGNFMQINGVNVLLDFAHNPHGISALAEAVNDFPAKRRVFLLGQAGDRSDDDIKSMTKAVRDANPDLIIVKELENYLRGRELGDVPAIIKAELKQLNYPEDQTVFTDNELEATKHALDWAQAGDLLVLLVYDQRKEVLELLQSLQAKAP